MRIPMSCRRAALRLFGAALILALLPPLAGAQRPARAKAPAPPESFISIRFADPAIPPIEVGDVAEPQPYGIHYSEEELLARDLVAVSLPPPDPTVYAQQWESRQDFDAREQALAQDLLKGNDGWQWGWSDGGWSNWSSYNGWTESGYPDGLLRARLIRQSLHPTPAASLPLYNLPEYRADYAAWRRGLERAALRGHFPSDQPARGAAGSRRE